MSLSRFQTERFTTCEDLCSSSQKTVPVGPFLNCISWYMVHVVTLIKIWFIHNLQKIKGIDACFTKMNQWCTTRLSNKSALLSLRLIYMKSFPLWASFLLSPLHFCWWCKTQVLPFLEHPWFNSSADHKIKQTRLLSRSHNHGWVTQNNVNNNSYNNNSTLTLMKIIK